MTQSLSYSSSISHSKLQPGRRIFIWTATIPGAPAATTAALAATNATTAVATTNAAAATATATASATNSAVHPTTTIHFAATAAPATAKRASLWSAKRISIQVTSCAVALLTHRVNDCVHAVPF
jgi:hypothetical protein